jgi:hypothetical protein
MNLESLHSDLDPLELSPDEQALLDSAKIQERENFHAEAPIELPEFRLIVGQEYILACRFHMTVVSEAKGLFLGLVQRPEDRPLPVWYLASGETERDLDHEPDQDPFDVVRIHRDPHLVYLLRDNLTMAYRNNNAIFTRDSAIKLALEHKYQIVAFKEVMDE